MPRAGPSRAVTFEREEDVRPTHILAAAALAVLALAPSAWAKDPAPNPPAGRDRVSDSAGRTLGYITRDGRGNARLSDSVGRTTGYVRQQGRCAVTTDSAGRTVSRVCP